MADQPTEQRAAGQADGDGPGSRSTLSRRKVLGGLAVGGAVLGIPGAVSAQGRESDRRGRPPGGRRRGRRGQDIDAAAESTPVATTTDAAPARFSRLFPGERAAIDVDDELRTQLVDLGRTGGLLDAKDPLEVGAVRLITDAEFSENNPNNPTHTAGTTFVGQFLDHDITRDAGSTLGRATSVDRSMNLRSARFDLDSVYGGGPADMRDLYEPDDPYRFRVESGGLFEDLPRGQDGSAIIADPRNDENLIIAGLQVAFLLFHNAVLDQVRAQGLEDQAAFDQARQTVIWHYQWLIVHQFLPQFVGSQMVGEVLGGGRRFYTQSSASIPLEFQTSAYRFGHSMIRPSYRANLAGDDGEAFFGMVFDPAEFDKPDPDDMNGGSRAPRRFIGWQTFFDFGDGEVKPNKKIDTHISTPLFQLPMGAIGTARGEPIGPLSLATRNLLRHLTWEIPTGEQIASLMGETPLDQSDLADIFDVVPRLEGQTPLWLYVLREADVAASGEHLGPIGGRIVAEVFIGLLELDPLSILNVSGWRPTLPSRFGTGEFRMVDLLTIAGVDPESRGQ